MVSEGAQTAASRPAISLSFPALCYILRASLGQWAGTGVFRFVVWPILSSVIKSENQDVKPQICCMSYFPAGLPMSS